MNVCQFDIVVTSAAREYLARRDRRTHPAGSFDKGGRWYPADSERRACCSTVRTPSRAWPYSELTHARSAAHVAALYGVRAIDLRRAARREEKIAADTSAEAAVMTAAVS